MPFNANRNLNKNKYLFDNKTNSYLKQSFEKHLTFLKELSKVHSLKHNLDKNKWLKIQKKKY